MHSRLAYVVSRFPHLPETFILREMVELERLGWSISLYPLISQRQTVIHQDAKDWERRARKISFFAPPIGAANIKSFAKDPGLYLRTWFMVLRNNLSEPSMLMRALILYPKAIWMAEQMQKEGVGHIHAHYATHPALAAWIIHQFTGIKYSVTVHAHDIFVHKAMLATKLRDASFVVAISEFNREFIAREVGEWVRPKTHVIHCGVNPDLYHPGVKAAQKVFKLVSIGSLQLYKGQEILIRACKLLNERGIPYQCDIIGGGDLHKKLQDIITELGLENRVNLLGAKTQEEISELLPQADCYIQPSIITSSGKMEGIPLALMEAMACSLPVVASDLSGIPELVKPGITGYLVPPGNISALADQIAYIFNNPNQAVETAQNGQTFVAQSFNLFTQARKLASFFETCS
jgi:colanic acid/amylovoran biosynthesis glycosyltransferase